MAKCILAPKVEENLWDIWEHIAKDNPEAAHQVVAAARATFLALAENPGLGNPYPVHRADLQKMRSRKVTGFDNYLIFYLEIPGGIEIIRVYSRFRDIRRLFRRK